MVAIGVKNTQKLDTENHGNTVSAQNNANYPNILTENVSTEGLGAAL